MRRQHNLLLGLGAATLLLVWNLVPSLAQAQISVVATTPEIAALVREVGGDRVQVETIAKPLQDPHYVDAKPSFMVKLNRAEALFFSGLELEVGWLPLLVQGARNPSLRLVDLGRGITVMEKPTGPISRDQGDIHPDGNPHYWLDPRNGALMARRIAETLQEVDPSAATDLEARLQAFETQLATHLTEWEAAWAPYRGTPIVDYHATWVYFAAWAGLEVAGRVEKNPGISPTAAHVRSLIALMRREDIPLILQPNYTDPKVAEFVAEKSGATLLRLPATVGGAEGYGTYWEFFDSAVTRITSVLAQRR